MGTLRKYSNTKRATVARAVGLSVAVCALCANGTEVANAAGDASRSICPNEAMAGFRASLPDCRAYEQVTPVFKGGFTFGADQFVAGGSRVVAKSLGDVAGQTSNEAPENTYDLTRTGSGWETIALGAPLSQFAYGNELTLLSDTGAALLELRPVSDSVYQGDLYLREADGSLVSVGPTLPSAALPPKPTGSHPPADGESEDGVMIGASPDLSHVLFNLSPMRFSELPSGITSNLWRELGDTTVPSFDYGMGSLYEYVGKEQATPRLVGVDDAGHLISQCGAFLGGESGVKASKHNAISTDGSTVYFTAVGRDHFNCGGLQPSVDELFARLDGSQTIAISEPSTNKGCTTQACLAATPADTNFEGASENGTLAFFTSTQQLLDGASEDGTEGDSALSTSLKNGCAVTTIGASGCNLYMYDSTLQEGSRLVLVSGGDSSGGGPRVQGVAAVSEDGSHVYFVAKGVLTTTANATGQVATNEADNLYMYADGHVNFIATLSEADARQWGPNSESPMDVASNGQFLVFTSVADLTSDDTSSAQQVFEFNAGTGQLLRVSAGNEGFGNDGNTSLQSAEVARHPFSAANTANEGLHPGVSEDGSIVVFQSGAGLTPQALNNRCVFEEEGECYEYAQNVYEYHDNHVYLISDGHARRAVGGSFFGVSPSGDDVFFTANDPLVPQDTDEQPDTYDARADGGFPGSQAPGACTGESCQGPSGVAPAFAAPVTTTLSGATNLASPTTQRKPIVKQPTREQELARALKKCKQRPRRRRACEAHARTQYRDNAGHNTKKRGK